MTGTESATEGAPTPAPRFSPGKVRGLFALVTGALVLITWIALIASSFANLGEGSNRLLADALLGLCVATAVASVLASVRWGIIAAVAVVIYAAAWWYIGWSLTYAVADLFYFAIVAAFFVAPPVAGICGILAGRGGMARAA